jgi:hypothetical protein
MDLCDDDKVADPGLEPAWGSGTPKGDAFLDDQILRSSAYVEVLGVIFGKLVVVVSIFEPSPAFVVNIDHREQGPTHRFANLALGNLLENATVIHGFKLKLVF